METASRARAIHSRAARLPYRWAVVRPCTASRATPASWSRRAISTTLMCASSQPRRNFTDTDVPAARTAAAATL